MDTVLCLDTSGSMSGRPLSELRSAVGVFADHAERSGLGERIAVVQFGGRARTVAPLTDDYDRVRSAAAGLSAGGATPMAAGLMLALRAIVDDGRVTTVGGTVRLMPRVILMTDGAPDSKEEVAAAAALFAQLRVPIACAGVTGCDAGLLAAVARATGGLFTMADRVEGLSTFFVRQVMLSLFIARYARDAARLYSLAQLRRFLAEQTGRPPDDAELEALLLLVRTMTGAADGPRPAGSPLVGCGTLAVAAGLLWAAGRFVFNWF